MYIYIYIYIYMYCWVKSRSHRGTLPMPTLLKLHGQFVSYAHAGWSTALRWSGIVGTSCPQHSVRLELCWVARHFIKVCRSADVFQRLFDNQDRSEQEHFYSSASVSIRISPASLEFFASIKPCNKHRNSMKKLRTHYHVWMIFQQNQQISIAAEYFMFKACLK